TNVSFACNVAPHPTVMRSTPVRGAFPAICMWPKSLVLRIANDNVPPVWVYVLPMLTVPVCISTVPVLLNGTLIDAVPVPADLRTVPALLIDSDPAHQHRMLPSFWKSITPPARFWIIPRLAPPLLPTVTYPFPTML